jgi:hypothetical protein
MYAKLKSGFPKRPLAFRRVLPQWGKPPFLSYYVPNFSRALQLSHSMLPSIEAAAKSPCVKAATEPAGRSERQKQWDKPMRGAATMTMVSNTSRFAGFAARHHDELIALCLFSALGLALSGLLIALGFVAEIGWALSAG